MASTPQSYMDYSVYLSPDFDPHSYANALVHQTNDATDTLTDLATPLSRVLFDAHEVDTHIDALVTQHARPLIDHTRTRADAGHRILAEVETQVAALSDSYDRLAREVADRHQTAAQVQLVAERLVRTVRLGRAVQRALALGRQLRAQADEVASPAGHGAMVPAAQSALALRQLFAATGPGDEGDGLGRVVVVTTLRNEIVAPAERALLARAQQTVREFSMSSLTTASGGGAGGSGNDQGTTFRETEDTKSRATCALHALYLLSPIKPGVATPDAFEPTLLLAALQTYLQTALTSSLAALARALATLPTLDRTLLEISARCQNIVALEALLESIRPPAHPLLQQPLTQPQPLPLSSQASASTAKPNFLQPLLRHLDTPSLPSYFWRTMAGQLSSRVHEILGRGGVSARTLRTNRDRVRDAVRECVARGSQLPVSGAVLGRRGGAEAKVGNWEREAAVMAGSIMGPLQR